MNFLGRFRARLIDEAGSFWKLWSIRLAAVASLIIGYVLSAPEVLVDVMNMMPSELRALLPTGFSMGVFALIAIIRLWKQKNPTP